MRTILATIFLLTSFAANATDHFNGAYLKLICETNKTQCLKYTTQGRFGGDAIEGVVTWLETRPYCIPKHITDDQIAHVYKEYLKRKPKALHWSIRAVITMSLKDIFPCPTKRFRRKQ